MSIKSRQASRLDFKHSQNQKGINYGQDNSLETDRYVEFD